MGVTLLVGAHDVVGVVEVRDVVEGHGRREVFVLGKSGLFCTISLPLNWENLAALLLALIKPVKPIFNVRKK